MNNDLIKINIATSIIFEYYKRLKELSSNGLEESDEYYETVEKLKRGIKVEKELYKSLSPNNYKKLIDYCNKHEPTNAADSRIRTRINDYQRVKDKDEVIIDSETRLSKIITTKLIIDILKLFNKKLAESDSEYKDSVMLYSNLTKYYYLTFNDIIEQIAVDNNFDIDRMPSLDFNAIEEVVNINCIDYAQNLFMAYITNSIQELSNQRNGNEIEKEYERIYNLACIEIALKYLKRENLIKIKDLCNKQRPSESMEEIKNIIKNERGM